MLNWQEISGVPDLLSHLARCVGATPGRPVVLAVAGRAGTGKSHFGRLLRKQGCPGIPPGRIVIIDDNVIRLRRWLLFKREVRIPCTGRDDLAPFLPLLPPGVELLVYITKCPADRLTRADILLELHVPDEVRRQRLRQRYPHDGDKVARMLAAGSCDLEAMTARHCLRGAVG